MIPRQQDKIDNEGSVRLTGRLEGSPLHACLDRCSRIDSVCLIGLFFSRPLCESTSVVSCRKRLLGSSCRRFPITDVTSNLHRGISRIRMQGVESGYDDGAFQAVRASHLTHAVLHSARR